MSIFETIGYVWVIFTSALATVQIFYFAIVGAANYFGYMKGLADLKVKVMPESEAQ